MAKEWWEDSALVTPKASAAQDNWWEQSELVKAPESTQEEPKPAPQEEQSIFREIADVPLKLVGGATTGIRLIADALGADNAISQNLRGVEDWIGQLYSAQSKKDSEEIGRIMKEAENKGVADQVVAGLKAFSVAPIDMVVNALGTSAPAIVAGLMSAPAMLGVGAVMGAGTAKSAIYDATKEILQEKTSMSPQQIEAAAVKAQEYGGENLDQILIATGVGAFASRTGAESSIVRQLSGSIEKRALAKKAQMEAAEASTKKAAERGMLKQAGVTAGTEAGTEAFQGGQEQFAANLAQQRQGFDTPLMQGVAGQATLEGVAGAGLGAVTGARESAVAQRDIETRKLIEEAKKIEEAGGTQPEGDFQFTSEQGDVPATQRGFTAEDADVLMPSSTQAGAATVEGVTRPEVTEETITAETTAQKYLDDIASGAVKKPNASKLRGILKSLDIEVESGEGFNDRALEAIAARLKGQQDATGTIDQTTGEGAGVVGEPGATGTEGLGATVDSGVDTTGADTTVVAGGEGAQPTPVIEPITDVPDFSTPPAEDQTKIENARIAADEAQNEFEVLNEQVNELENEIAGLGVKEGKEYDTLNQRLETLRSQSDAVEARANRLFADYKALSDENKLSAKKEKEEPTSALTFPQRRTIDNPVVKAALAKTPYERKEGVSVPNLPPDAEQKYTAAREELLPSIRDYNEKRKPLAEKAKDAEEKLKRLRKNNASEEEIGVAEDALNDAEFDLQEYGPEITEPKEWYKLDSWEKEVLFDSIKSTSIAGADEADILDYRDGVAAISEVNTLLGDEGVTRDANERRIMLEYDRNRGAAKERIKSEIEKATGKTYDFSLPRWSDLSDKAKELFRNAVQVVNPNTNKLEPTLTLEQQDAGYEAVVAQLLAEENLRGELSPEVVKQREEQLKKFRAQREKDLAELKKVQEDYERRNKGAKSAGATTLPNNVIEQLQRGNLNAALDFLLARLNNKQNKSTAEKLQIQVLTQLRKLNLKTKVTVAGDMLPDGDLARYYTDDDHIIFSPSANSFTVHTLAHEVTHAATVTVLYRYLNKQYNMITAQQRAAAAQIEKLFKATKPFLGEEFANAYENPYEFVAYAMTNKGFANALNSLGVKNLYPGVSPEEGLELTTVGKEVTVEEAGRQVKRTLGGPEIIDRLKKISSILPAARNAWSVFKQSVAEILGIPAGRMSSVNYLMEMHAAFEDILAAPTDPIYLTGKSTLAAKGAKPTPKKATKADEEKLKTHGKGAKRGDYLPRERHTPNSLKRLARRLFTRQGWQENVRDLQDQTYFTRAWQTTRDKAGQVTFDMSGKFTNIADQYDRGMAEGRNYATYFLQEPIGALRTALADYAEKYKLKVEEALADFHIWAEMFHEPERRRVNFVTRVPLSTDATGPKGLVHNGKPISAADRRVQILGDQILGTEGLIHRVDLTEAQRKALWKELQFLADNYADADGYGPALSARGGKLTDAAQKKAIVDENSEAYNALGVSLEEVADRRKDYDALPKEQRAAIEDIFAKAKAVSDAQAKLDKIGKYWSRPVDNLVGMYDYQHYMPFKGFNEEVERYSDFRTMGADLQEQAYAADGRFSTSENPILQLLSDAYRAAARAGRRNYTQAIKNAAEQKLIPGAIVLPGIPFAERQAKQDLIAKFKGARGSSIFHYDSDGTLYIIQIKGNDNLLRSMRLAFRDNNSLVDIANDITGFFGAMHTRYNYNFAPLNFVRDTLTNAWNIGASGDLGPAEAAKYLRHVSTQVVKNGLSKAWTVARLHESGKPADKAKLKSMAEKDPFVKAMLELIKYGGKTTYLEGFSLKSNLEKLNKGVGNSKVANTVEGFTQFVDSWNYMFEFTSRAAAYELRKESMYKRFIKEGMGPAEADVAAATEAAIWTKNLANFEKTGTYGRNIGALYMFFRPSVTGAVRAAQAALPAFPFSEKFYVDSLPQDIKDNPKLKEKYLENFRKDRKNARIMVSALMGAGYMAYMMAALMSPDDDWGRNNVKNDNMQQWTRYWRIHLPGGGIVQIPWGFGLGAFAASGAQLAAAAHGNEPIGDALGNIAFSIMTDAFLPLPISRMSAVDEPASWVVDTVMPTTLRPMVEYVMNKDGLGRTINSTSQRRMGDAYTGGDKINEMYKDAAKYLYKATDGAVDLSPNTLYFFTNSYADGIGKVGESLYSFGLLGAGQKEFKAKTDIPFIGSFIGAETNVDSREYGNMEKKIKNIDERLKTLYDSAPQSYSRFVSNNPTYPAIVDIYKAGQGELNEIRKEMNEIRSIDSLSPKERDAILNQLQKIQNAIKYSMNRQFKVLGLRP